MAVKVTKCRWRLKGNWSRGARDGCAPKCYDERLRIPEKPPFYFHGRIGIAEMWVAQIMGRQGFGLRGGKIRL
jgi:hypothetical protein